MSSSIRDNPENFDICPFGPSLQHYWDRLSPLERRMKLDREALYSLALQSVMVRPAAWFRGEVIVDLFCGAGGSTIALAREGKSVIAIDHSESRLAMARENAKLFSVADRIKFVAGDALTLIESVPAKSLYLDPPWGGVDYSKKERFSLSDFSPSGENLLERALNSRHFHEVVIRLPKNFEVEELTRWGTWRIDDDFFNNKLLHRTAYWRNE